MTQNEVFDRWSDLTSELNTFDLGGGVVERVRLIDTIQEGLLIIKYGKIAREYRSAIVNLVGRQIEKLERMIIGG